MRPLLLLVPLLLSCHAWRASLGDGKTDAADTALPLAEVKRLAEKITTIPGNF